MSKAASKLERLIARSGQSRTWWAGRLEIAPSTLSDMLTGRRCPSLPIAARIERVTKGKVRAVDWLDEEPQPAAASKPKPAKDGDARAA